MNCIILTGNACADPEQHTTQGGIPKCSFTLAVNRQRVNAQGNREADFIPVVCWRSLAETCGKYVKRGMRVGVEGRLQTRQYDAQDGTKRTVTEVVAYSIEFPSRPEAQPETALVPAQPAQQMTQADDNELPF